MVYSEKQIKIADAILRELYCNERVCEREHLMARAEEVDDDRFRQDCVVDFLQEDGINKTGKEFIVLIGTIITVICTIINVV